MIIPTPLLRTRRIALHTLSPEAEQHLSQRLYQLHCRIFSGVSYEAFRRYVVASPAQRTWLYVRETAAGEWVGYTALHAFHKQLQIVFRMETGSLPAYRGKDLTALRVLGQMIRTGLRHWPRPCYFFCSLVHPSSYALVARYAPTIWPNQFAPTPPAYQQLLYQLAEEFHLAPVAGKSPMVREVNWVARETTRPVWNTRRNSHVAYFLEQNPTYGQGHGLLTIMPAQLSQVLSAFARFALVRGRRLLRRQVPATWQEATA